MYSVSLSHHGMCAQKVAVLTWSKDGVFSLLMSEGHSSDTCSDPKEESIRSHGEKIKIKAAFKSLKSNLGNRYHHDSHVRGVIDSHASWRMIMYTVLYEQQTFSKAIESK